MIVDFPAEDLPLLNQDLLNNLNELIGITYSAIQESESLLFDVSVACDLYYSGVDWI